MSFRDYAWLIPLFPAAGLNPANGGLAYYNLGATLINRNKPKEAVTFLKKSWNIPFSYHAPSKLLHIGPPLEKSAI